MVKYLDRSESLEVDMKDLEYFLLVPDEPNIDIKHIALHATGDGQKLIHTFARQGGHKIWVASAARWDEHERMLIIHEQRDLLGKKHSLERMNKERGHAKTEEVREKLCRYKWIYQNGKEIPESGHEG